MRSRIRRLGRQHRRRVRALRGPQRELEEEAHGRAHEERRVPPGPGRVLGRGRAERAVRRQGELLGRDMRHPKQHCSENKMIGECS